MEHKHARRSHVREIKQRSGETRKQACSDLCKFFISTPQTEVKSKSINFHQKYELSLLRFLWKIVNLFHNNMHAQYPRDIHARYPEEKLLKFMSYVVWSLPIVLLKCLETLVDKATRQSKGK